jgi:tape measure domain-containing protein|nr:MAG TPA: tail tape measure [Caudoviricetes sp.]
MAADGKVSIEVVLEDGSVAKGIADLTDQFDRLGQAPQKANVGIGSLIKSFGLMKIAGAAIDAIKGSLDSAISRFDTMQKFPKVMNALGFSAEDSKKSIGKLSDGIDGLPTKLDDVVASTQQMTAITGDLDRSTDTVIGLNNAFLASGASADDAARGTQQFNQMLSTGTVDLESWKTLQETMPLALQKTAEAMGYTGKSAQRDLYAALQSGEVTFEEFNDQIIKLGTGTGMLAGLAKENSMGIATSFGNLRNAVAKNVANMITKLDEITQKLTGKTIAQNIDSLKVLINTAMGAIVDSMDLIVPAIQRVSAWLQPLIAFVQQNAEAFRLFGIVLAGVAAAFATFFTVVAIINQVKAAIDGLKAGFDLLKVTMAANPFALIVTAIIAFAAAIVYLWNTNEGFRNAVIAAWTAIQAFMQPIISAISSFVQSVFGSLLSWWQENQQLILSTAQMVWATIQVVFSTAMAVIQGVVSVALTAIQAWWNTFGSAIMALTKVAWAAIKATFQSTLSTIQAVVKLVMNQIQTVIKTVMGVIQGVIKVITGAIKGDWSQVWNGIKQITSSILNGIKDTFSNVLSAAASIVSGKIDAIKGFFKSIGDINLVDIGKNIIQGLINGVSSMIGAVGKAIGNVVNTIKDKVTGLLGIHSPSRWFRDEIGKMIPPGLAIGIDRASDVAVEAGKDLGNTVKRSINAEGIIGTPTTQNTSQASRIINRASDAPVVQGETLAGSTFEIPVVIQGDAGVWARGTAKYTWAEIQKMQKRDSRKRGVLMT